jgi:hypothetical protein
VSIASSIEAAASCLDVGIRCELTGSSLREPFEHGRKVLGINRLRLGVASGQMKYGAGNLILTLRRQLSDEFKRLFQELRHRKGIRADAVAEASPGHAANATGFV